MHFKDISYIKLNSKLIENPSQTFSSTLTEILEKQKRCLELSESACLDLRDVKQIATSSESREVTKYYAAIGNKRCGSAAAAEGYLGRRGLLLAIFAIVCAISASYRTRQLWDWVELANLLVVTFIRDISGGATT